VAGAGVQDRLRAAVAVAATAAAATLAAACGGPADDGWLVTVYYTAVAAYHDGPPQRVTGCPRLECGPGDPDAGTDLGEHPAGFVTAVRTEGTGRTADGRYLNWSVDVGYWLDTAPRDSAGTALQPWQTAAADADVLEAGSRFAIVHCGRDEVPADVCARLRQPRWTVRDEFTPGLGGSRHVDVYIGEETGPDFTGSDWYVTLRDARLEITRSAS
jgi:hypothetical protein